MSKDSQNNILYFLQNQTDKFKNKIALGMRNKYGWQEYSYDGLSKMSQTIAAYLINEFKIKREEKIAIISQSKIEFGAVFFASIIAGSTLIPVDIKLTKNEMESIFSSCSPSIIFVSKEYFTKAQELKEKIKSIKEIILLDDTCDDSVYKNVKSIYSLKSENAKFRHRSLNSTALIIYTSGTTGCPKGVEITFKNMLFQIRDLEKNMKAVFKDENIAILSILPLNHLFELSFGFMAFLNLGYSIYYTKSLRPNDALSIMHDKKIRFMCTVPSFFRLLKSQFESDLAKSSKFKRIMFHINYHYIAKFLPFSFLKKRLFRDIHEKFGNNFYGFLSGGAPMDYVMGKYFNRIGINVFQGYGLSEASPVVTCNVRKKSDIKSVGYLLDSFEAKIDESTGELLVKGPCVMKGYYNQPELTKEAIDKNNWLHTGDIARIDRKGQVFITGRIKNMIVLPGGKKVFPEEVESTLNKNEYIKEAVVVGIKRNAGEKKGCEEVVCFARAKDELWEKYDLKTVENLVISEIKKETLVLAQYKRPTNIVILKEEFPKTATNKIKRNELKELLNAK